MNGSQEPVFRSGMGALLHHTRRKGSERAVSEGPWDLHLPAPDRRAWSEVQLGAWFAAGWSCLLCFWFWVWNPSPESVWDWSWRLVTWPVIWFLFVQVSILFCSLLGLPLIQSGWMKDATAVRLVGRIQAGFFSAIAACLMAWGDGFAFGVGGAWLAAVACELVARVWDRWLRAD